MNKLKLGLPAGSLKNSTFEIFKNAGFKIHCPERSYFPSIDDEEIEAILIRAQEIPRYIEEEVLDMGLTGKDWITETKADVVEVAELIYAKEGLRPVRLVLAVPNNSPVKTVKDLEGKRIATELVEVTRQYLAKNNVRADVEFSWGATEVKPPKLVDAIAELTETGNSLRANNLRIVETILESTTRVIANKKAWKDTWKKQKIENIVTLLKGALRAEGMVGLKMNLPEKKLPEIINIISALKKPTISPLTEKGWIAIEIIINEHEVRELILKLKSAGAEGIVEYPLNKIIL
ncbi:MAG: ATP phosphoribosyltransferase [bacterium]